MRALIPARRSTLAAVVLVLAAIVWLACGSGDEKKADSALSPPPAPTEQAPPVHTPEELRAFLNNALEWPADKGAEPDIVAEYQDCEAKAAANPQDAALQPLGRFLARVQCMLDKGWVRKPQAE
jgi:hypothetical protein